MKAPWWKMKITLDTPENLMDDFYKEKDQSYKQYGVLGDTVAYSSSHGEGNAEVIYLSGNERRLLIGTNYLHIQKWVYSKYWVDTNTYDKTIYEASQGT